MLWMNRPHTSGATQVHNGCAAPALQVAGADAGGNGHRPLAAGGVVVPGRAAVQDQSLSPDTGGGDGFASFFHQRYGRTVLLLMPMGASRVGAEDAAQEAVIAAWRQCLWTQWWPRR